MSSPTQPSRFAASGMSALRNIGITVLVLVGLYIAYGRYQANSRAVREASKAANEMVQRDLTREYLDASKKLNEALAIRASDPYAIAALAEVEALLWVEHGLADRAADARKYAKMAVEDEINYSERFSADCLVKVGAGDLDAAEKELLRVVKEGAATSRIVGGLGIVHLRQGKLDLARSDFKQAADRDWRSPRFAALMGDGFYANGDFLSAQGSYQKGVELSNGMHLRSLIGRIRADAGRGERVNEGMQTIADILTRSPEDLPPLLKAKALAAKAEMLLAAQQWPEAEQAATEAVNFELKDPKDPEMAYAHYDLGIALARQKKGGALQSFKNAIDRFPAVARFYYQGAQVLAEAGEIADGQQLLDMAAKALRQNDAFFLARADFQRTIGETAKAHESYDEALKLNDVNAEAYYKKGSLYQWEGEQPKADKKKLFELAKQQYERAVTVRERYPEVYRAMGLIYLDLKPTSAEALEQFVKAINFYKEQKASRAVIDGFIEQVAARYVKYGLKNNAEAWKKEAGQMSR